MLQQPTTIYDALRKCSGLIRKIALILACVAASPALAADTLPTASDFATDASTMRRDAAPMAVLYSQHGCSWCDRARAQLVPMSKESDVGALFRQVDIDRNTPLRDFSGTMTTHRLFAQGEDVRFTPMLVIYGPSGERLAEPIAGMGIADFYAEYVLRAIAQGRARMQPQMISTSRNTPDNDH